MDYIPLRIGARHPAVSRAQRMLHELGYFHSRADGLFCPRTLRAVIAFQSDHELPIDGILATNTWIILERLTAQISPPKQPGWQPPPPPPVADPTPVAIPNPTPTPMASTGWQAISSTT